MRVSKLAAAIGLGISALGLAGCATGFPAQVSRYQAMPAPQGQSFIVVPANPANQGGLEFARFAALVTQQMQARGYRPAASINQATMVVQLGYGVDEGERVIERDPFYRGYGGYGGFGYGGYPGYGRYGGYGGYYGRPYYSRFGYYGARSPFYYGWDDPFFSYGGYDSYGGYGPGARSYTRYESFLDLKIRRKGDNASLFEGHAEARSQNDNLGTLVPNLVEAMFTGFPGRSGETVKITVPPPVKR